MTQKQDVFKIKHVISLCKHTQQSSFKASHNFFWNEKCAYTHSRLQLHQRPPAHHRYASVNNTFCHLRTLPGKDCPREFRQILQKIWQHFRQSTASSQQTREFCLTEPHRMSSPDIGYDSPKVELQAVFPFVRCMSRRLADVEKKTEDSLSSGDEAYYQEI